MAKTVRDGERRPALPGKTRWPGIRSTNATELGLGGGGGNIDAIVEPVGGATNPMVWDEDEQVFVLNRA